MTRNGSGSANYGIDAPPAVAGLALAGAGLLAFAAFGASSRWAFVPGPLLLAEAALMIWGSRVGKVRLRER